MRILGASLAALQLLVLLPLNIYCGIHNGYSFVVAAVNVIFGLLALSIAVTE